MPFRSRARSTGWRRPGELASRTRGDGGEPSQQGGGRCRWRATAAATCALAAARVGAGGRPGRRAGAAPGRQLREPVARRGRARASASSCSSSSSRGRSRSCARASKLAKPFLDISDRVKYGDEEGLLSVAFDPDYERTGASTSTTSNNGGDIEVDEFKRKRSGRDPRRARGSRRTVITIPHPVYSQPQRRPAPVRPRRQALHRHRRRRRRRRPATRTPRTRTACSASCCGSTRVASRRLPDPDVTTRSSAAPGATRSTRSACATRGVSRFDRANRRPDDRRRRPGRVGGDRPRDARRRRGANFGWDNSRATTTSTATSTRAARLPAAGRSSTPRRRRLRGDRRLRRPRPQLPALAGRYLYADFCGGEIRSLRPATPPGASRPTPHWPRGRPADARSARASGDASTSPRSTTRVYRIVRAEAGEPRGRPAADFPDPEAGGRDGARNPDRGTDAAAATAAGNGQPAAETLEVHRPSTAR